MTSKKVICAYEKWKYGQHFFYLTIPLSGSISELSWNAIDLVPIIDSSFCVTDLFFLYENI